MCPLDIVVSTNSLQQNKSDLSSATNSYEVNPRNAWLQKLSQKIFTEFNTSRLEINVERAEVVRDAVVNKIVGFTLYKKYEIVPI